MATREPWPNGSDMRMPDSPPPKRPPRSTSSSARSPSATNSCSSYASAKTSPKPKSARASDAHRCTSHASFAPPSNSSPPAPLPSRNSCARTVHPPRLKRGTARSCRARSPRWGYLAVLAQSIQRDTHSDLAVDAIYPRLAKKQRPPSQDVQAQGQRRVEAQRRHQARAATPGQPLTWRASVVDRDQPR